MKKYAEVVLPLPLQCTYTYSIPEEYTEAVTAGTRVMVQFGKKKFYTGIVESVGPTPAGGEKEYDIKPIMALPDSMPIATPLQMRLWRWVADYYLCTPGDVMKAAIPTGLKPESETRVTLNKDREYNSEEISKGEAELITLLAGKGAMSIGDLAKESGYASTNVMVEKLLKAGIVEVSEKVVERYRARKETLVRLALPRGDMNGLHDAMGMLSRSAKQQKLLMAYLEMSDWMRRDQELRPVGRKELLEKTCMTSAILKGLTDKGLLETYKVVINRISGHGEKAEGPAALSAAQQQALNGIRQQMGEKLVTLLHGVTGSGKTEIYTHLIQTALDAGKQVLYLVPEISLTTQLTDRLRKTFGDKLTVYHSKFTDNERVEIYRKISSEQEPMVVLGVRSSVLLPYRMLGLVIVDEEHESSYKQYDPAPRYNARDTAIMLANMHGAKVLLGSATPSIETYYKALEGKYGLVNLKERYGEAEMPEVEIVDMKSARKQKAVKGILSDRLRLATDMSLNRGEQVILFQNRRGFAPMVMCRQCGWSPKCENCDVSLVYHKQTNLMRCHYCGFTRQLPSLCPVCGGNELEVYGYGTERIAEEVHTEFPGHRVARMDLDTTRNKENQQEIIEEFASGETDILVGTQMVSKGLDFAGVKLVGVINADTLLNFPDFRSNERAFNMLEQVSGRAGRHGAPGKVMIQTTKGEEDVLKYVKAHDYEGYYRKEIKEREMFHYPPFTKVINIYVKHKDATMCDRAAVILSTGLRNVFGQRVLGPQRPFVSRIANWHLQTIMLKVEAEASMQKVKTLLREIYAQAAVDSSLKGCIVYYDVDPA